MRRELVRFLIGFVFCVFAGATVAAEPSPCPPELLFDGASQASSQPICQKKGGFSDTEYGPVQIASGTCPNIPSAFGSRYAVATEAEFSAAYSSAKPGDAIIVENGTKTWGAVSLNRNGEPGKPIYILAASLYGVTFRDSTGAFELSGNFNVVSGFSWIGGSAKKIHLMGSSNRIACNKFTGGSASMIYGSAKSTNAQSFNEIDNNTFDASGLAPRTIAVRINSCDEGSSSCTSVPESNHFHHNVWQNDSRPVQNSQEALAVSTGKHYAPERTTYASNQGKWLIENNLFNAWNGEDEIISLKLGGNLVRNNCFLNLNGTGGIVVRNSGYNIIHGNWFEGGKKGPRFGGGDNLFIFNYHRTGVRGAAFRFHTGNVDQDFRYIYPTGADNKIQYNVMVGNTHIAQTLDQIGGGTFYGSPTNNVVSGNDFYTSILSGSNASGAYTGSEYPEFSFRTANTWGQNNVIDRDLPPSLCGNAAQFSGPGKSVSIVPTGPKFYSTEPIAAPSWW